MADAIEGTVQPKKADSLAAAYAEIRKEPYEFEWPEGQFWTLPHISELDYRLLAEVEQAQEKVNDLPYLEGLFSRLFGDQAEAWAQVPVPTSVLFMLFDRWVKHSGGELGEEQASPASSKSTGTRSRRTSGASTAGSGSRKRSTAKKAAPKVVSLPAKS